MTTAVLELKRRESQVTTVRAARGPRPEIGGLVGIAAIAALYPARKYWAADVALLLLVLVVPGVLALRAIRVPGRAVQGYPLYIPAASVFVVLGGGLLADLAGPSVGIDKPLHGYATGVTTLGLCAVLWVVGMLSPASARFRWRALIPQPTLLLPLLVPALSAAGALLLTNGEGPILARVAAGLTVATLIFCLLSSRRLSPAHVAMMLFAVALAAEWSFSLRSHEVIGFDITTESQIAQHTQAAGIWQPVHHNNAYAAMLSITVLPSALAALTGIAPLVAFKAVYPVFTALLPVSVFLIGERFMRRPFAAGAAALVLVQSYFFQLLPELARQEVGLLFFAVLIAGLVEARLPRGPQIALVSTMAAGLVVSHYSSTYLAIPAVVIALILQALLAWPRRLRLVSIQFLCAAIVLIGGAALWDGTVTSSSNNLTSFAHSLEHRGLDLLPNANGSFLTSYLSGNVVNSVPAPRLEQLAVQNYRRRSSYIHPLPAANSPQYQLQTARVPEPRIRSQSVMSGLKTFSTVFGELMLALAVIGAFGMAVVGKSRLAARQIGMLAVGCLGVLALIRFSGTFAAGYNQTRALLQSLILLALPAAWLVDRLTHRLRWRTGVAAVLLAGIIGLMFAYQLGVTNLVVGGGTSLNLSQRGEDFERLYMTRAELAGAAWASDQSRGRLLYADPYGQLRLWATSGKTALTVVTPRTLDHHAWLYGTRTNTVLGRARGSVGPHSAIYQWPSTFLNTWYDKLYTDGDSAVYHR